MPETDPKPELSEPILKDWYAAAKRVHHSEPQVVFARRVCELIDALRATRQELALMIQGRDAYYAKLREERTRIAELEQQLVQMRKWANLGGAPAGKTCTWDADDIHEIYGSGYTLLGGVEICSTHEISRLTEQSQRDRERIAELENVICELKGARTEDQWDMAVSVAESALAKEPSDAH